MTPNGPSWRHEELKRVEDDCEERCEDRHKRTTKAIDELKADRMQYITRTEFEAYKEVIKTRYANVVRIVDGLIWCVLVAVVGALLYIVIPGLHGIKN